MILEGLDIEYWYSCVERGNFGLYPVEGLFRIHRRTRDQDHVRSIILQQRQVKEWLGGLAQAAVLHISGDAYYSEPIARQLETLAESVAFRPVAARHRLIDDDHRLSAFLIPFIEIAALQQRNAHRLKIVRADSFIVEAHVLIAARHVAVDGHICEGDSAQGLGQASR